MPVSMENNIVVDWTKPVGPAKRSAIVRYGTEDQRQRLKAIDLAKLTPEQQANRLAFHEKLMAPAPAEDVDEDKRLKNCLGRMYRTMNKRAAGSDADPAILTKAAKVMLYRGYCEQVEFETGKAPVWEGRRHLVEAMHKIAHWLVGQQSTRPDGLCNCEKNQVRLIPIRSSLYLYGGVGTGKSTLAIVANYVSRQLNSEYNTGFILGFTSLDEMMLAVAASQTVKPIEDASKGSMVLDDLKREHLQYKHFGNDLSVIATILTVRHHIWKQTGAQTIITSNIKPKDLPGLIGDGRVQDRLLQQYEIIPIGGETFRDYKAIGGSGSAQPSLTTKKATT